jgi:hypothetical protein
MPPPLLLRRIAQAYPTEPERYVAMCGDVRIGSISHDPTGTHDQKWTWSLTIIVQAMVRGEHHGRASERIEAMQMLRRAFDKAGIDLDAARYKQRGVEVQRCVWGLHKAGVAAALSVAVVSGHATPEEIEAAHRAALREIAESGIDSMQRIADHRDAWQRALARGDDVSGMVWDRVQAVANEAMAAECLVTLGTSS